MTKVDPGELLTFRQAGRLVGVSHVAIVRWVAAGKLGTISAAGKRFIRRSEVLAVAKARRKR